MVSQGQEQLLWHSSSRITQKPVHQARSRRYLNLPPTVVFSVLCGVSSDVSLGSRMGQIASFANFKFVYGSRVFQSCPVLVRIVIRTIVPVVLPASTTQCQLYRALPGSDTLRV